MKTLKKLEGAPIRPVLTIVMDGVGLAPASEANAVKLAKTQTLDMLMAKYPMLTLKAHGTAVGLPSDDDMGNSEVGHNALAPDSSFMRRAERYIPTYGVSALQTIPIIFAIYILGILS